METTLRDKTFPRHSIQISCAICITPELIFLDCFAASENGFLCLLCSLLKLVKLHIHFLDLKKIRAETGR